MSTWLTTRPNDKIEGLRREAACCQACPLWKDATQTVFGEGRQDAEIMLVGEQPGDREDREGRPFVGPAQSAPGGGVDRKRVYASFVNELRSIERLVDYDPR